MHKALFVIILWMPMILATKACADSLVFEHDPTKLSACTAFGSGPFAGYIQAGETQSTRHLTSNSILFKTFYNPTDWSGKLVAFSVKDLGPTLNATGAADEAQWQASIPDADARQIYTWNGSTGREFRWEQLGEDQKDTLASAFSGDEALAQSLVNYLRGTHVPEWRSRTSILGDIVNSEPVYVGAQDYAYHVFAGEEGGTTYEAFVQSKKERPGVVYVGANDGMLHAFVAVPGAGGSTCDKPLGTELFAYVPNIIMSQLHRLKEPTYTHRAYVDGPIYVGDAYVYGQWRTILIGTLGAGGKGLFALDVTKPCEFDQSKVLWEFSDAKLGHSTMRPAIARLNNGVWAVIASSGYNTADDQSYLLVIRLADGQLIKSLSPVESKGLGAPALYDADGDGDLDRVYAGDASGNAWRFDLQSSDPEDWRVDVLSECPSCYPVTSAPEIGPPPFGKTGVMVYLGTGRRYDNSDNGVLIFQQTLVYAIWDNEEPVGKIENYLQSQVLQSIGPGNTAWFTSTYDVDYSNKRGWGANIDGHTQGYHVVSPMLRNGRLLLQVRLGRRIYSSPDPSKTYWPAPCETAWFNLNPITGWGDLASFNMNGDNSWDIAKVTLDGAVRSVVISGVKVQGSISSPAIFLGSGVAHVVAGDHTTATESIAVKLSDERSGLGGRVSWREIID